MGRFNVRELLAEWEVVMADPADLMEFQRARVSGQR